MLQFCFVVMSLVFLLQVRSPSRLLVSGLVPNMQTGTARFSLRKRGLGSAMKNYHFFHSRSRLFASSSSSASVVDISLKEMRHNGCELCPSRAAVDAAKTQEDLFLTSLSAAVESCRANKKSAAWLNVEIFDSHIMKIAASLGFSFHHAEGQKAALCLWLSDSEESKVPVYGTHQVGVGAVCINSLNQILCVREIRGNYSKWKLPGGLAELGENLDEAVQREVKEETGIDCSFKSVLAVRHTHGMQFGRSDLYFIIRVQPDEGEGGVQKRPVAQAGEIESAQWVPLEDFQGSVAFNAETPHPFMQLVLQLIDQDRAGETHDIQRTTISSIVPGRMPSPVYHAPLIERK